MQVVLLYIHSIYNKYLLSTKQAPFLYLYSPLGSFYIDVMFLYIYSKGILLSQYSTSYQLLSQLTTICYYTNQLLQPLTTMYCYNYQYTQLTTISYYSPQLLYTAITTSCCSLRTPVTLRLLWLLQGFKKQIPWQPCSYQGTLQDCGCRLATTADSMARALRPVNYCSSCGVLKSKHPGCCTDTRVLCRTAVAARQLLAPVWQDSSFLSSPQFG